MFNFEFHQMQKTNIFLFYFKIMSLILHSQAAVAFQTACACSLNLRGRIMQRALKAASMPPSLTLLHFLQSLCFPDVECTCEEITASQRSRLVGISKRNYAQFKVHTCYSCGGVIHSSSLSKNVKKT